MSKFEKVSEELETMFYSVKDDTTIPQWVEFEVLSNNKQKEIYKIVKMNDLVEVLTEGVNFVVVFNEEIFEQLPEDYQKICITESLAGVCVNDNDVISLERPNFTTYRGILQKFGHETILTLHESIKSLYDVKKQKEDEEKAQKKEKRTK